MRITTSGVPEYEATELSPKTCNYCILIPALNEGPRLIAQLAKMTNECIFEICDIVICDGGSNDEGSDIGLLRDLHVNSFVEKIGNGKQGAQLRCGIHFALSRGYVGIITVDGNDKDSTECVPLFVEKLMDGYDFVQGSRFVPPGQAINTPPSRYLAVRCIHAPITSMAASATFTDTTNGFRGYSATLLRDPRVAPLRDVFSGYELLAYLPIRAGKLGYKTCEVPVVRAYPKSGPTPTKISPLRGNANLLVVLIRAATGRFDPTTAREESDAANTL